MEGNLLLFLQKNLVFKGESLFLLLTLKHLLYQLHTSHAYITYLVDSFCGTLALDEFGLNSATEQFLSDPDEVLFDIIVNYGRRQPRNYIDI